MLLHSILTATLPELLLLTPNVDPSKVKSDSPVIAFAPVTVHTVLFVEPDNDVPADIPVKFEPSPENDVAVTIPEIGSNFILFPTNISDVVVTLHQKYL